MNETQSPRLQFFSNNPGKRATEKFWLAFTPVWGGVAGVVMMGGLAETWGDVELMIFSLLLAAGAMGGPLLFRCPEEKGLPIHRLAGFRLGLSVTGFAFFLNYSQTPFFYDVLHMHYGFNTEWNIENNPIQMYVLSVAYFSTYCALLNIAFRAVKSALRHSPRPLSWFAIALVPFAIAFLETAMNANPLIPTLFCYDDLPLMLGFGTFCYGLAFCFALPMWISIDEEPGEETPLLSVGIWLFAALYADVLVLDLIREHLAPHLTTVVEGANGLRDFDTSCLIRPGS